MERHNFYTLTNISFIVDLHQICLSLLSKARSVNCNIQNAHVTLTQFNAI